MRGGLALMGVSGFLLLQRLPSWYPQSAVVHVLGTSLLPPTKLAVVMSVAWLLLHLRWQRLTDFFRLLGIYALFAFIVHRILLHSIDIGLTVLAVEDARYRYGLLLTSTMLLTFGLCWWRQRHAEALRTSGRVVKAGHAMRLSDDCTGTHAGDCQPSRTDGMIIP